MAKITYLDRGTGGFTVDASGASSAPIARTGDGEWKTATVSVPGGAPADGRFRVSLSEGVDDLVVRFVRVIRT